MKNKLSSSVFQSFWLELVNSHLSYLLNLTIISYWQPERDRRRKERAVIKTNTTALPNWAGGRGHLSPVSQQAEPPLAGGYDFLYLWMCRGTACQRGSTDPDTHNVSGCSGTPVSPARFLSLWTATSLKTPLYGVFNVIPWKYLGVCCCCNTSRNESRLHFNFYDLSEKHPLRINWSWPDTCKTCQQRHRSALSKRPNPASI